MNLKKMERYLQVNLLGPGPRLIKKEFTGPRSHKGWETLVYTVQEQLFAWSPGHMSKIKPVPHAITSDFCKGKPYPDPQFAAFWDVILRSLVKKKCWHFKGPCYLHHHNREHSSPTCPDDGCSRFLCNITHYTSNRLHSITSQNTALLEPRTSRPIQTH